MKGLVVNPNVTRRSIDSRIGSAAARQYGCVSTAQLQEFGLSMGAIRGRVYAGRLYRVVRGVYSLTPAPYSHEQRCTVAVLSAGDGAAVSHLSAAMIRGLWKRSQCKVVDVICARRTNNHSFSIHYSRQWDPTADIEWVNGLPLTTVERMVVDLTSQLNRFQITNVVKEAAFWGKFNKARFDLEMERVGCRAGTAVARRAVESFRAGCAGTRSALEDRFVRLIEVGDVPMPGEAGVPIGPHEVDFLWRDQELIVEVDGPGHRQPNSRKKDPARDADLRAAGFHVVRFTKFQIDDEPLEVVRQLVRLVG